MQIIYLSSDVAYEIWDIEILCLTMLSPRCKITQLAIISVICEPHLWSNKQDPLVPDYDTTVIGNAFVNNGPFRRMGRVS
jgi:hypothetical protein